MPAPFRFVLLLPDRPEAETLAMRRVCGLSVAERLLESALRAGAVELWTRGRSPAIERLRARLARFELRVGEPPADALPTVEAPAHVELSAGLFELLATAEGPVFVPGMDAVAKDARLGERRPLFEGEPPPGVHALPVTCAREVLEAKRQIFRDLASPSASSTARLFNAPLSRVISWFLVETRLTPAMATAVHAAVGLASALFFAVGELGALLVAGALFELASVLDGVDGELARAKLLDSPRGAWIDTAGDAVAYLAFVVALPLGYAKYAESAGSPWAPAIPALGAVLSTSSVALLASMASYAARAGHDGSMSRIAAVVALALPYRSLRVLVELGRRAFFSKVVALLSFLGALTGDGVFYDALFFGTVAAVLSMSAVVLVGFGRRSRRTAPGP